MFRRENVYEDEVLKSPFSRVYLQPETEQIINCSIGLKYPPQVEEIKNAFSNSIMVKHPRFRSLMVNHGSSGHWRKTHVNIDDHIIIHTRTTTSTTTDGGDDEETALNAFLADLAVSNPLSKNKPLWELHVLMGLNCLVLRIHHALGDGASLMAMLSACFGKENEERKSDNIGVKKDVKKSHEIRGDKWKQKGAWGFVKTLWFSIVFALQLLGRLLWVKDKRTDIYGGDGVELWPRELFTAKFKLEDFKSIKKAIPNVTINDVLLGVISSGLSKYLATKTPKAILQVHHLTAILMVNLRKQHGLQEMSDLLKTNSGESWGNRTGLILQSVRCDKGVSPLNHVKEMKASMDQKKQSLVANIPYIALKLIPPSLGPKVASWICHRILCNTTLLISNIMGPSQEMAIADNPITYIRVNISSNPQAITLHMVSYAGRADLQVMVAKDIIPDSQFLAKCFQDALLEMKLAVKMT